MRIITRGALFLCAAMITLAQNTPAPAKPADQTTTAPAAGQPDAPEEVERLEEKAYVRRFSAGISLNLAPFNLLPKQSNVEKPANVNPPLEINSSVDPQAGRFAFAATLQVTISDRIAIALQPTYRKIRFHGFLQEYVGVDNSSTIIDERVKTEINEDTKAVFFDVPVLVRRYSKSRFERGPRWFYEAGPTLRFTRNVTMDRSTVTPKGETVKDNIPLRYNSTATGASIGIGGQFIDDFGIRAIPEVRYTRWFGQPFDTYHGRTRRDQIEIVMTFSF
jgi:hypothetical protein